MTFEEFREKVVEALEKHEHENEDEILDDENSLEDWIDVLCVHLRSED